MGITVFVDEDELLNWTHNISPMIRLAGFKNWPYGLSPEMTGQDLADEFKKTLVELVVYDALYSRLNPESGWGSRDQLAQDLKKVISDLEMKYPHCKISVHA